jgi:hypothetical protein
MLISKTTTVSGGGLFALDLEVEDAVAVLIAPLVYEATLSPTTVSISHIDIDSGDSGVVVPPDPEAPNLFYGIDSQYFGYGSYPLNGFG